MKTNYILIDYENVQPRDLTILNGHSFKVKVFVGSHQTRIPLDLAEALQALGSAAEYIRIEGNGPNALDFHIAFYMGQIAENDPNCYFHIISKDKGFDPLIQHLKSKKIFAQREKDLLEIPLLNLSNTSSTEEKIGAIIKNLAGRGASRPRKVKTLANTINALFQQSLQENELKELIEALQKRQCIVLDQDKVSYRPPISQPGK